MINRTLVFTLCLTASGLLRAQEDAPDTWPREITVPEGTVVIYQPQPESLEGNRLKGRSAVAVELTGQDPVFGAIWFDAELHTDRAERTATIASLTVPQVRFPNESEEKSRRLIELMEKEVPGWGMEIDLDRLLTSLGIMEERAAAAQRISTAPPVVIFEFEPAVLITVDGEPQLRDEEGTDLQRVINTPFTILRDAAGTFYLNADAEVWYTASSLGGEWKIAERVPQDVRERAPKPDPEQEGEEDPAEEEIEDGPPPKIIVATEPTELIVIEGRPNMSPITDTNLLYLTNTDSDVVFDIENQKYYVLLSGRWYESSTTNGPWEYVPGEAVPEDFAKIPEEHEMGTVLYAVPGTAVAKEAVLDAQVPQTAVVERSKASLTVEYDGEPILETIEGTEMHYAVNTATPVIRAEGMYYACDEAVWFQAVNPRGPWMVATVIPAVIYTIPPESPLYHVTHVYIYKATPEVIYVGYTPGYTGTYVYHTTIVYGTGYWYRPWYGTYYYPRRATWGFHVRWNPWMGWSFGFSYGVGPFRFTIGRGGWWRGGWWGPGRHRSYRRGYRHGYRRGARSGFRAGYRAGQRNSNRNNLYRNQRNQNRTRPQPTASAGGRTRPSTRPNNVYADRNGNVQRRNANGTWDNRTSNGWQRSLDQVQGGGRTGQTARAGTTGGRTGTTGGRTGTTGGRTGTTGARTQQQPQTSTTSRQQMNRSYQTRQQGSTRSRSYSRARGGGGRMGGRRR